MIARAPLLPLRQPALAVTFGILAICSLVIATIRLHTFHEPLDRDIAAYLVVGNEWLHGKRLYSEVWDHKPPAIHVAYAIAIATAGYGPEAVYLLAVLTAVVTLFGVYSLGSCCGGGRLGGLLSAVFFTLASGDLGLEANQPNVESFMNACAIWFLAILLKEDTATTAWGRALLLGAIAAVGTLFKQVLTPLIGIALLCNVLFRPGRDLKRKHWVLGFGTISVLITSWVIVGSWYSANNAWPQFYGAVFQYNQFYSGSLLKNLSNGLRLDRLVPPYLTFCIPMFAFAMLWFPLTYLAGRRRQVATLFGAGLGIWLAIALPAHFFPHYYQLWLPLLTALAGAGVAYLWASTRLIVSAHLWRRLSYLGVAALWLASVTAIVRHQLPGWRMPASQWPLVKFKQEGRLFCEIPSDARALDNALKPGDSFFAWGLDPGLYYYSGRRPITTVVSCHPLLDGPLVDSLEAQTLEELEKGRPPLVAISRQLLGARPHSPSLSWVLKNYQTTQSLPESAFFVFFERR